MKWAVLASAAAIVVSAQGALATTDFCEGFKAGYKAGYCYQQSLCMAPMAPMCPMTNMGESGFQDGYNRGFVEGAAARN